MEHAVFSPLLNEPGDFCTEIQNLSFKATLVSGHRVVFFFGNEAV